MEGAKSLEVRPRGTSRRMGRGTFGRWRRELGRPSPARRSASAAVGASRPITGAEPGSGWRAGRASEAAVVPLEPAGQQNPGRWEGPLLRSCVTYREGLVSARDGYDHQARPSPRTATGALPGGQGQPKGG